MVAPCVSCLRERLRRFFGEQRPSVQRKGMSVVSLANPRLFDFGPKTAKDAFDEPGFCRGDRHWLTKTERPAGHFVRSDCKPALAQPRNASCVYATQRGPSVKEIKVRGKAQCKR